MSTCRPVAVLSSLSVLAILLNACGNTEPSRHEALAGLSRGDAGSSTRDPRASRDTAKPVAIIQGVPLYAEDLSPQLAEAAGAVVVEEAILDRALAKALGDQRVTLGTQAADAERQSLIQSLMSEANLTRDQAETSLQRQRTQRGLGPVRFDALLLRNARLRALARPSVTVTDEELSRALAIEYGPRYRTRIIMLDDARKAGEARAAIVNELPPAVPKQVHPQAEIDIAAAAFARWAVRSSLHPTAPGGGLVSDLSPADTAFPEMVRETLPTLNPGEPSRIFAVPGGYWIALVEAATPAKAEPTAADREALQRRLTARRERLEMDRIANQLMTGAGVTVLDPSLRWSWEGRPR